MRQVIDGVYVTTQNNYVNMFVFEGTDGLVLVDAGLPGAAAVIEKGLAQINRSMRDIKHILITHAHPDHIGGLAELQRVIDAPTYVHRRDALVVRGEIPVPLPRPEEVHGFPRLLRAVLSRAPMPAPAKVDVELNENDILDNVYPGLCVVGEPGHSAGQVGFWMEDKRLLFAGDVIMRFFGRMRLPMSAVSPDMAEVRRSVRKVADMNINVLCQGHGAPYVGNGATALREFVTKLDR